MALILGLGPIAFMTVAVILITLIITLVQK